MIIHAVGYGTRMHRFTCGTSKELLEVGGKPVLMYALQEAYVAGLSRAGIDIRKGKSEDFDIVCRCRPESLKKYIIEILPRMVA